MIAFQEILHAYRACQKNKNRQWGYWKFDFDRHHNLYALWEELKERQWTPGPHKVFVVTEPKPREVWAALFRDRVVHHWVYGKLWPIYRRIFIPSSYACIPKKGTLRASLDLKGALVSRGYRRGYFLKMDIKNFFNSIHRPTLWKLLLPHLKRNRILYDVVHKLLFTDIRQKAICVSKEDVMALVPSYKSLFYQDSDRGLPIGNLTSQFFANVYLNELDQFVYGLGYDKTSYFRYMDDWVLLNDDKHKLKRDHDFIVQFLRDKLLLEIAQDKTQLASVSAPLDFVGYVHHKGRTSLRKRIRIKWYQSLQLAFPRVKSRQRVLGIEPMTEKLKQNKNTSLIELVRQVKTILKCRHIPLKQRQTWASYLGRFCHTSEYSLRLKQLCQLFTTIPQRSPKVMSGVDPEQLIFC